MALALMLETDEDALVCDFAETYHIYDLQGLPTEYAAVLAYGLKDDSRIKMVLSGKRVSTDTFLLGVIADRINWLSWTKTKDGSRGRNRPQSILDQLLNGQKQKEVVGYRSGKEFEAAHARLIRKITQWQQEQN